MEIKKTFIERLHKDYNWREMTDNYNEKKIVEVVKNLSNNATHRYQTLTNIMCSCEKGEINEVFLKKMFLYYQQMQLEEIKAGRDVVKDIFNLYEGSDAEDEVELLYWHLRKWQDVIQKVYKTKSEPNNVFQVENINNYGYIADVLNQKR